MITLRPATPDDVETIATVWHRGWRDGHLGHVPDSLHPHRQLAHFLERVPPRLHQTTVATVGSSVVGFVTVHDDEVEQIYVAESARGGGAATALLRHAEQAIAARFDRAWLAVVAGNSRARRFYERSGWRDAGAFDYAAEISGGSIPVPCLRYEKRLTGDRGEMTRLQADAITRRSRWTAGRDLGDGRASVAEHQAASRRLAEVARRERHHPQAATGRPQRHGAVGPAAAAP